MIEASKRIIAMKSQGEEKQEVEGINPAITRYLLEIKTLQNAPRDAEKLEGILEIKQKEKEETIHIEEEHKCSYSEIEMFKVILYFLVARSKRKYQDYSIAINR